MTTTTAAPTTPQQRIDVVDILRGFALFGILIVNIILFGGPYSASDRAWDGFEDHLAQFFILVTAEGKFYPIFAFLFGIGFILQISGKSKPGVDTIGIFRRRLFFLFLIGLFHLFLLSHFDILVPYALLGYLLLVFRDESPFHLARNAVICLIIPFTFVLFGSPLDWLDIHIESATSAHLIQVYRYGTFGEIFVHRLNDIAYYYQTVVEQSAYKIFSMFLIGAAVAQLGVFRNIPKYTQHLWWFVGIGLVIGFPGSVAYAKTVVYAIDVDATIFQVELRGLFAVSDIAISCFYVSAITLLLQNAWWQRFLNPLSYVGRMALTNYLTQSLICTTLFYGYGFGLYGQLSPKSLLPIAILIYVIQVIWSNLWLRRYRFGPAEWAWRSLTYGKMQPLRIARPEATATTAATTQPSDVQ